MNEIKYFVFKNVLIREFKCVCEFVRVHCVKLSFADSLNIVLEVHFPSLITLDLHFFHSFVLQGTTFVQILLRDIQISVVVGLGKC